MGRAFEYRKATKFKRWNAMSKTFTRIGKQIAMAVKAGGPLPENNTRLRILVQNAKGAQMPKANIESAIKKAAEKDQGNFEEVTYEGYGPYGVAIVVDTATDNTNRTVANVRSYFNKYNGSFGSQGSVTFMFETKALFRITNKNYVIEDIELELIDAGLEEVDLDLETNELVIITDFNDFGKMQTALEALQCEIQSSDIQRFPTVYKEITAEQEEAVYKLIDKLEEDEDVNHVYHNIKVG